MEEWLLEQNELLVENSVLTDIKQRFCEVKMKSVVGWNSNLRLNTQRYTAAG